MSAWSGDPRAIGEGVMKRARNLATSGPLSDFSFAMAYGELNIICTYGGLGDGLFDVWVEELRGMCHQREVA